MCDVLESLGTWRCCEVISGRGRTDVEAVRWSHMLCLGSQTLLANSGTWIRGRLYMVEYGRLEGIMKDGEVFLRQGVQLKNTVIRFAHHTRNANDKQDSHHSHFHSPFSVWTWVSYFPSPREISKAELLIWPCFFPGLHEDKKHDGCGNTRQMQSDLPSWRAIFFIFIASSPYSWRSKECDSELRICLYSGCW